MIQQTQFIYPVLGVGAVAMHSDHLDLAELEVCEDTLRSWRNNGRNHENRAQRGLRAAKNDDFKQVLPSPSQYTITDT
jgi:hypothetical protein